MRNSSLFTVFAVVTLLASGCADKPAAQGLSPSPTFATEATVTADAGGIEGKVLDEEQQPIGGATIGILRSTIPVITTTASGEYAFSEVPVGKQQIFASALGFNDEGVAIEIMAGEITHLNITLKAKAIEQVANLMTPGNNILYLHAQYSPRVWWLNDIQGEDKTQKDLKHDGDRAGYNSLGFVLGTGVSDWTMPLLPEFPSDVRLDTGKPIIITLYVGAWGDDDVGTVKVSSKIRVGEKLIAETDVREVTFQGNQIKLEWEVTPKDALLPADAEFAWTISAEGIYVDGMAIGVCRKCEAQSRLTFPVI